MSCTLLQCVALRCSMFPNREEFLDSREFFDLVDFGDVAFSVETFTVEKL